MLGMGVRLFSWSHVHHAGGLYSTNPVIIVEKSQGMLSSTHV